VLSEGSSKEIFFREEIGIRHRFPAKQRPLDCQARGKRGGRLPELERCCWVGSYLQGWASQEGSSLFAVTVAFHTKVLSHTGLGERRSFRGTREVLCGEIYGRPSVIWTEMLAGLPTLKASSVSGDHTAGKMCELQKNFCGAPWFSWELHLTSSSCTRFLPWPPMSGHSPWP